MFRSIVPVLLLFGLGASPLQAQTAPDPYRSARPTAEADFAAWLAAFRPKALAEGVSTATLDRELAGLVLNARVIAFDRSQPDDSRPQSVPLFADYLARRLTADRIGQGQQMLAENRPMLAEIVARYGVPAPVILGIWGMETSYGSYTGDFDIVRSLASLAFDGRREVLFTRELIGALKMIDRGVITRPRLVGSWAGATGNPQFLPTTYLDHAADGNGDGRADIWENRADTAASIASYLKAEGWRAGGDWAIRVAVPPGFDRERVRNLVPARECARVLAKHSRWIPVAEWRLLGLAPLDGRAFPGDDVLATLVEPDGPGRGAYLTFGNYRALLGYNCSNFYALSVGLLADAIAAPPPGPAAVDTAPAGGRLRIDP